MFIMTDNSQIAYNLHSTDYQSRSNSNNNTDNLLAKQIYNFHNAGALLCPQMFKQPAALYQTQCIK